MSVELVESEYYQDGEKLVEISDVVGCKIQIHCYTWGHRDDGRGLVFMLHATGDSVGVTEADLVELLKVVQGQRAD